MKLHLIKPGEQLIDVAARYGMTLEELLEANAHFNENETLAPGTKVKIPTAHVTARVEKTVRVEDLPKAPAQAEATGGGQPPPSGASAPNDVPYWELPFQRPTTQSYEIQPGDTLWKLTQKFSATYYELKLLNPQMTQWDALEPGTTIQVPAPSVPIPLQPGPAIPVTGGTQPPQGYPYTTSPYGSYGSYGAPPPMPYGYGAYNPYGGGVALPPYSGGGAPAPYPFPGGYPFPPADSLHGADTLGRPEKSEENSPLPSVEQVAYDPASPHEKQQPSWFDVLEAFGQLTGNGNAASETPSADIDAQGASFDREDHVEEREVERADLKRAASGRMRGQKPAESDDTLVGKIRELERQYRLEQASLSGSKAKVKGLKTGVWVERTRK